MRVTKETIIAAFTASVLDAEDAAAKNGKGTLKLFILMMERLGQRAVGTLVQKIPSCCFCFRFITHSVYR